MSGLYDLSPLLETVHFSRTQRTSLMKSITPRKEQKNKATLKFDVAQDGRVVMASDCCSLQPADNTVRGFLPLLLIHIAASEVKLRDRKKTGNNQVQLNGLSLEGPKSSKKCYGSAARVSHQEMFRNRRFESCSWEAVFFID
ncbi:hypothetical protein NPIL_87201 [Nephila pilipes]|uniref:Uncharacterized protein n=1 Tax=Nephila pilipes TaxID=299642 RepID=A0A8X6QAP6_NEPPI|nr:hypothetical protein NPIL_39811 [Nephila pilipes]GFU16259.1 hypothetical protein NPIL_87201 [Nephila pilipes]